MKEFMNTITIIFIILFAISYFRFVLDSNIINLGYTIITLDMATMLIIIKYINKNKGDD